jgi:hypothetical protein
MSSQIHGDIFENQIIKSTINFPCIPELHKGKNKDICLCNKKQLDALKGNGHIDSLDIPKGTYNGFDFKVNTSVKLTKSNGIGCGDIIKFTQHVLEDLLDLVVGRFSQYPNFKEVYEIIVFHIKPNDYKKLWGSLDLNGVLEFVDYVKSIPNGLIAQAENSDIWKEKRDVLLEGTNSILTINAKIDSNTQRRVQGGFKLENLLLSGVDYTIYSERYNDNLVLPYRIKNNPRRSFEKKKQIDQTIHKFI